LSQSRQFWCFWRNQPRIESKGLYLLSFW